MTAAPAASVADALAEVETWFQDLETRHQTEILEVDQEIKNIETALVKLNQQLEALHKYRVELGLKARTAGAEHVGRAHTSLYEALRHQRELLDQRELVVAEADAARRAAVTAESAAGAIGALITEFKQFKRSVEPTLAALPESYRSVVLKHHQSVTDKLRDHFASTLGAPLELGAEAGAPAEIPAEIPADVVYAIDAPEGDPEMLVVVLPVNEAVYSDWESRSDGLGLWIAYRVVQAVYEAAAAAGFVRAQVVAGGHQGLLVIEVDLTGAGASFVEALEAELASVLAGAPELVGARVRLAPRRVHIDYVMPPEPEATPEVTDA